MEELVQQLAQLQINFMSKMDEIANRVAALKVLTPIPTSSSLSSSHNTSDAAQKHFLKLDAPRLSSEDPQGWILKISQFFSYHATSEEEHITVTSFHLDDAALSWYQWMYRNGQIQSLTQFLQALESHFSLTAYDDPRSKLFKLSQTSSVANYLGEFESLANRIVGLSSPFFLSCFVSCFKLEIRREVLAQQPTTPSQATGLARLHEDKFVTCYINLHRHNHPGRTQAFRGHLHLHLAHP